MRELAGYDHGKVREVLRWPLREGLLSYVSRLRERARQDYYVSVLSWAVQAPYASKDAKPPTMPKILKGE